MTKKTIDDLISASKRAIDKKEQIIYDVADNKCQIVDNVKHTSWFIDAVANEITLRTKAYQHLHIE
jgi:hypothetical protein